MRSTIRELRPAGSLNTIILLCLLYAGCSDVAVLPFVSLLLVHHRIVPFHSRSLRVFYMARDRFACTLPDAFTTNERTNDRPNERNLRFSILSWSGCCSGNVPPLVCKMILFSLLPDITTQLRLDSYKIRHYHWSCIKANYHFRPTVSVLDESAILIKLKDKIMIPPRLISLLSFYRFPSTFPVLHLPINPFQ